jgi:hypothetical protein
MLLGAAGRDDLAAGAAAAGLGVVLVAAAAGSREAEDCAVGTGAPAAARWAPRSPAVVPPALSAAPCRGAGGRAAPIFDANNRRISGRFSIVTTKSISTFS